MSNYNFLCSLETTTPCWRSQGAWGWWRDRRSRSPGARAVPRPPPSSLRPASGRSSSLQRWAFNFFFNLFFFRIRPLVFNFNFLGILHLKKKLWSKVQMFFGSGTSFGSDYSIVVPVPQEFEYLGSGNFTDPRTVTNCKNMNLIRRG
jgi:hypothetical protein